MAETEANRIQMTDLIFSIGRLLAARDRVHVGGNLLCYYNPANGRDHLSPDVFVAFDVAPGLRERWLTWVEGKFPEVAFEITSPSTMSEDLGSKKVQYARLGVREYYLHDPSGVLRPRFQGFELVGDRLEPLSYLPDGGIFSPLLGAELRVMGQWLRVIDPRTGLPVPRPHELDTAQRAAEERAATAEERAASAEAEAAALRAELARLRQGGADPA